MTVPKTAPKTAMVLAAGLGTRMRPLTDDRPKALVEVGGRALIDHMLDRLAAAGVETAVVNVHYFADLVEAHLARRQAAGLGPRIVISDERGHPLETGGGLKAALPLLGGEPVWVANIDAVWIGGGEGATQALAEAWDPARMDVCLLLTPTEGALGFHDSGDVFLRPDGQVVFKTAGENAPWLYVGLHICRPAIVADGPEGPFSLTPIWRGLAAEGRVGGAVSPGAWLHVGDPEAREAAQARLAQVG